MKRTYPLAGEIVVQVGGEFVDLVDLPQEARDPQQYSRTNPLRIRTTVYDALAYHRNPFRLAESALDRVVLDFVDRPVLDHVHAVDGGGETAGKVESGLREGSRLKLDMALWGPAAVGDILSGIRQGWSISWGKTSESKLSCSICGEDALDPRSGCTHMPGLGGAALVYSDGEPLEVTRTYAPGVVGTGVDAVLQHSDEDLDQVTQAMTARLERLRLERPTHEVQMPSNLTIEIGPGAGELTLRWDAEPRAESYRIYRGLFVGFEISDPPHAEVSETSFTDAGLEIGEEYFYRVTALVEGVEGEPSQEVSATPDSLETDGASMAQAAPQAVGQTMSPEVVALRSQIIELRAEIASMKGAEMRREREHVVQSWREAGKLEGDHFELVNQSCREGAPSLDWLKTWMAAVPGSAHAMPGLVLSQQLGSLDTPGGGGPHVVHGVDVTTLRTFEDLHNAAMKLSAAEGIDYREIHRALFAAHDKARRAAGSRHK